MPEPPDFRSIVYELEPLLRDPDRTTTYEVDEAVGILTRLWNARGAADCAKLEAEWRDGIERREVERALRSVDR